MAVSGFHTYYAMVMSVRPGLRPSVRLSVRPSVRPALRPSVRPSDSPSGSPSARFPHFSHTRFDILTFSRRDVHCIMVWCCPSVQVSARLSVRPTVRLSVRPFPNFSHTRFDILSWNFAHYFVLMYYRSNSSVVILRQFLKELCLFVNL